MNLLTNPGIGNFGYTIINLQEERTYEVLGDSSFVLRMIFQLKIQKILENLDEEIKERIDSQQINIKKFGNKTKMVDEYLSLYNEVVQ